jgi:hypothetical protein
MNFRRAWGCAAIAAMGFAWTGVAAGQDTIVKCESINYRHAECHVDGGPVTLVRQLSSPPGDCIEGRTWSFDPARSLIWVSNGCRAEFRAGRAYGRGGSSIVLYEHDNFGGRSYTVSRSVANLNESGFNDRASSAVVRGGRWQICEHAYFGGRCEVLSPGEYPSLRATNFNDRVSSVRELGWTPDGSGGWSGGNASGGGNWGDGGRWGTGARAVLYEGVGLSGRVFVVAADGISNLDRSGFNDRASSLRVEAGYWLFCSDANFQGECRTFGPGDYTTLPPGLSNRISSGRQISRDYPYRGNPNWSNN